MHKEHGLHHLPACPARCVLVCLALAGLLCACAVRSHTPTHERDAGSQRSESRDATSETEPSTSRDADARTAADAGLTPSAAAQIERAHDAGTPATSTTATQAELPGPIELVRTRNWPGGGVQLTFMPLPGQLAGPEWAGARLLREDGSELSVQRAALAVTSGITALVIAPAADAAEHAARLEAAHALIAELPDDERIGIWLGTNQLPLVCELSERRTHVLSRLAAIPPQPEAAAPIDGVALLALQRRLSKVGGPYRTPARVLIGVGVPELNAAVGSEDVRFLRLGRHIAPGWDEQSSPATAGHDLAAALLRTREQGFRLAACGVVDGERLALELNDQRFAVLVPSKPSGLAVSCDAGAAARDDDIFPDDVTLLLDQTQLAEHDRLAAAKDESDFTLQIALGDGEPIAARAHFRGNTSLECARQSYSIHFSDNEARRLMANANANEFLLLSMCWDKGWFRQALANRMMRKLGLFPLEQHYVRLQVGGRDLGVYLMLEKPDESLRSQQSQLAGLVRRRYDPAEEAPESQWPKPEREPEQAARVVSEYQAVVALIDTLEPSALAEALSARLDLDQYLRWLAAMNLFQSGDYADEVFFYTSDESAAVGGGHYFRVLGWDADDLFSACHLEGKHSIKDPYGLLYCLEGKLDRALFVAPDIYARFAAELAALIAGPMAVTEVERELNDLRSNLTTLLSTDSVCTGTGLVLDGQPATCATLQPWLGSTIDEFAHLVGVRSRGLVERLRKVPPMP